MSSGQHYVGEKHFDSLDDLVADGLICFYVHLKAPDYIASLANESHYEESPYMRWDLYLPHSLLDQSCKSNLHSWPAGDCQMNFHSVEIFPRDVNCRKRHHSGSILVHMRACAIGSQSPTSTTLSHFWLLGSKYEHEMGPKTKTKTYEFTEFSLFLTLSLPRNHSEWY